MLLSLVVMLTGIMALGAVVGWVRGLWVAAQPDQWLLRVRNGKVVDAGIGVHVWRRPGDVIVRFSSTVQRVRFMAEALSAEHVPVAVDGFLLWSVALDPEKAFRAYSKLGIANVDHPPPGLKSRAHLLTSVQHHAFQALLAAEVRAEASTMALADLMGEGRRLVTRLAERLASFSENLGIAIERIEIIRVEPADKNLLRDLSARSEEAVREEAAHARLEAAARLRQRQAEESKHEAVEAAAVQLATEAGALELMAARRRREELELSMAIEKKRLTAEGDRDVALALQSAEEQKSQAARDHELSKFVAEQVGRAMASWRIRDGKWIQLGPGSPVSGIAEILIGMKELVGTRAKN
jgi:hypothetical protein